MIANVAIFLPGWVCGLVIGWCLHSCASPVHGIWGRGDVASARVATPANVPTDNVGAGVRLGRPGSESTSSASTGAEARFPSRGSAPLADAPPGGPPPLLALDGYCPVSLAREKRWVKGDRQWAVIHRGQTYLCGGPEQAQQFSAEPESYAPAASGIDLVAAVEQDQAVLGRREHGSWYGGRVYLFANEATHQLFERDPERYVSAARLTPASPAVSNASQRY